MAAMGVDIECEATWLLRDLGDELAPAKRIVETHMGAGAIYTWQPATIDPHEHVASSAPSLNADLCHVSGLDWNP